MKEIVILSGKGGTGKTSLSASFAVLAGKKAVVADCDVDAANLHLLLKPDFTNGEDFYSGTKAVIDYTKCIDCGKCQDVCRFDAVNRKDRYEISLISCEGCGYCSEVCPQKAINMELQKIGNLYSSMTEFGFPMIHACLAIGADNSGKLVAEVKKRAKAKAEETGVELIIADGSPGIGCPVVSSLSGADYIVIVTEPTVSGIHDLKRLFELIKKFNISAGCIINKFDLNLNKTASLRDYCREQSIDLIAEVPYDMSFPEALNNLKTPYEYCSEEIRDIIKNSWSKIYNKIFE